MPIENYTDLRRRREDFELEDNTLGCGTVIPTREARTLTGPFLKSTVENIMPDEGVNTSGTYTTGYSTSPAKPTVSRR